MAHPTEPMTKELTAKEYQVKSAKAMTEKQFQTAVLKLAKLHGWLAYHTHDSRRSQPGFPDLVLIREGQLIVAELKTMKGRLSKAQEEWLRLFRSTGTYTYVWKPIDLLDGFIEGMLED